MVKPATCDQKRRVYIALECEPHFEALSPSSGARQPCRELETPAKRDLVPLDERLLHSFNLLPEKKAFMSSKTAKPHQTQGTILRNRILVRTKCGGCLERTAGWRRLSGGKATRSSQIATRSVLRYHTMTFLSSPILQRQTDLASI